ncbi:helix-turn-helix domain-containing protein [Rhodopirellula baltica]
MVKKTNSNIDFTDESTTSIPGSMAKPFGEALRFFRLKKRLTQEGLARLLAQYLESKVGQSYVSRIERGDFVPGPTHLAAIYQVLDCDQHSLWAKTEKFDEARRVDASELDQQLLNVLGHKRFKLSYESMKAIEKLLLQDDRKVRSAISEIMESIARPSNETDIRLVSVGGMVKTSIVSGEVTYELIEIIRFLVKQRDELYQKVHANSVS